MPAVSIIITTHSRPHLLERAIDSAFAAGTKVEVVVVDDASTDDTAKVCQALKGIRYVRLVQNQGVAGARNVGVLVSSGDYIALLDDDDVRLPGSLDLQLAALRDTPGAALIYGQALFAAQLMALPATATRSPVPRVIFSGNCWRKTSSRAVQSYSVVPVCSVPGCSTVLSPVSTTGIYGFGSLRYIQSQHWTNPLTIWRRPRLTLTKAARRPSR